MTRLAPQSYDPREPAPCPFPSSRCGAASGHDPSALPEEVERAKNRTKSKVRSRVEHAFWIIKGLFGFAKVRYRGLAKNLHRLRALTSWSCAG